MIGIVTGLRSEARCIPPVVDRQIVCSGGDPERARKAALDLIGRGVEGLVSFGLAGGLGTELRPGDLLLPKAVVLPGGDHAATDAAWRARIEERVQPAALRLHDGVLAGSDRLLVTVADKRALREATGALAVDMESHAVAQAARRGGVPFMVIRAIADPCDQALPETARNALGPEGQVPALAVLRALLDRPGDLLPLLRLGWQSGRAHATLRRVTLLAGPALLAPG
ncbi:MAG: purine phosphorylase [Geminicoccaceae bacterium]